MSKSQALGAPSLVPRAIVIGAGAASRAVAAAVQASHVDVTADADADAAAAWRTLPDLIAAQRAQLLLITVPIAPARLRALRVVACEHGARVGVVPVGARRHRMPALWRTTIAGIDVLLLPAGGGATRSRALARATDVVAASLLLLATLPIWLWAAIAIPLDSPGPVLFAHDRVGRDGARFRMWKFRTMRGDAPPYARSPDDADPNVTRVGRLLRAAGLDEIPQLLNVLRGDMRLVGPRPEMPYVVADYTPLARERLRATPGLTGLWQLCGDRGRPIHEQLEFDFCYLACASPALDARLLLGTARHAFCALTRRAPSAGRAAGRAARRATTPATVPSRD